MVANAAKQAALKLRAGDGHSVYGESVLAVAKGLLQSGVAYISGYQGGPTSYLIDVLSEAQDTLSRYGIHFENSGHGAVSAAMLAASINHPLRGAAIWQSGGGSHAAADALSNLASGGITGGVLGIVGEDYGEYADQAQERTYGLAMQSQIWMLDPKPDLSHLLKMTEQGFELSEASRTPVLYMMRRRHCHMTGEFSTRNNVSSKLSTLHSISPKREVEKIVLPTTVQAQERDKSARKKLACAFIKAQRLNEIVHGKHHRLGLVVCGGLYNTVIQALKHQGLADIFGQSDIPLYVLNVVYPLVPEEVIAFCEDKTQVLLFEEGQPAHIESEIRSLLHQKGIHTQIYGKDLLPMAGEYSTSIVLSGLTHFLEQAHFPDIHLRLSSEDIQPSSASLNGASQTSLAELPVRPPGLCTGCPERPLFSAIKQLQDKMGSLHVSLDQGCHSFAALEPFNLGSSIMGYGLALASNASIHTMLPYPPISIMGDGGFWHDGLSKGVVPAVFNQHNGVLIIIDNGSTAITGGQRIPSSPNLGQDTEAHQKTVLSIEAACQGAGVSWIRKIDIFDVQKIKKVLHEALIAAETGLKVLIVEGECTLIEQERTLPLLQSDLQAGKRSKVKKFYVDPETCTGDHACIRLSGCPSLTLKSNPDPLKVDPIAHVDNDCTGCGLCGSNAQTAKLCPSFSQIELIHHPSQFDKLMAWCRQACIGFLQSGANRRRQSRVI